ncbi:pyrroline-5-carboxylate reductase [Metabacillus fastidiosus]|uniref:pyrroline-5-carboxylate reductase n=1 Tax=Metabacillus fastidiosus TaxID=1458 RepID=UPI00399D522C
MKTLNKIGVIGAGSMAEAIVSGLIKGKLMAPDQIIISNRSNSERLFELQTAYGVKVTHDKKEVIEQSSIILLAMKPKDVEAGINSIKDYVTNQLIISVLAGVSISTISQIFEKDLPVVRAMPNTSASIGKSATAIAANDKVTADNLQACKTLFEAIGSCTVVKEAQLDAVTGLSGSGPAYLYYFVESLEKAAEEVGLEGQIARELILQTIAGAAEMLTTSGKHASVLRKEVTSPNGTTEAGLTMLKDKNFEEAVISCVKRATERSEELKEMFAKTVINTTK